MGHVHVHLTVQVLKVLNHWIYKQVPISIESGYKKDLYSNSPTPPTFLSQSFSMNFTPIQLDRHVKYLNMCRLPTAWGGIIHIVCTCAK